MVSEVYFTNMRTGLGDTLPDKMLRLILKAGIEEIDFEKKFTAIKMHFGELGNMAYLRPGFPRIIAETVRKNGGIPFLTDCSTLYVGNRKSAPEHLDTANLNGFNPVSAGCQIIIADGLKGTDDLEIPIEGEYVKTAKIGRAVCDSDVIITLSHFKCHELTGFGGALKNLAMGCASRRGKMEMHSAGKPSVDAEKCRGCGACVKICAHSAVTVSKKKASIDGRKCTGCGRCIGVCAFDAISSKMDQDGDILNAKIAEYAMAVVKDRPNFHITVISDVSPYCDCHAENDAPVIPNVGILASFDPVALDKACVDLALKQPPLRGSVLHDICGDGTDDMFAAIHPKTRWQGVFEHAEKLKFGSSEYRLTEVE